MPDDNPQGGDNKADALQKLLDKNNGDAMRTLGLLFSENYDLREKNRKLKEQVPAEGSVVMKKEDADRLAAFDALGLKPEDAKKKIEATATVEAENAKLKRNSERDALTRLGYAAGALADFDELEGAAIESYSVKTEKKDGKDVEVAYVKVDGKERALDEYAAEKRPAQARILREAGQPQQGRQWPSQDPGGRAPQGDKYEKIRKDVKGREEARQGQSSDLHPIFKPPQQQAAAS